MLPRPPSVRTPGLEPEPDDEPVDEPDLAPLDEDAADEDDEYDDFED